MVHIQANMSICGTYFRKEKTCLLRLTIAMGKSVKQYDTLCYKRNRLGGFVGFLYLPEESRKCGFLISMEFYLKKAESSNKQLK